MRAVEIKIERSKALTMAQLPARSSVGVFNDTKDGEAMLFGHSNWFRAISVSQK